MLKAVVIEDEPKTREAITNIINRLCHDIKVVANGHNIKTGIDAIYNGHPDILLIDVELSDGTAFDILRHVFNIDFQIIFVTAHEGYALKAIKFSAFDYILKPFSVEELTLAVDKAAEAVSRKKTEVNLETLLNNIDNREQKRIVLKTADEIHLVNISDIINCEADSSYTHFFLKDGSQLTVSNHLKEYDELLKDHHFFRVHHSYLVNLNEVKKFHKISNAYVLMSNGKKVPVSSRKKERLLEKFNLL
ncbi:MAG TPA: response regulator transcription factor [Bacteroidetes bacterium]|nr:response regulator transcription factor [Bacteroidota bacterium]